MSIRNTFLATFLSTTMLSPCFAESTKRDEVIIDKNTPSLIQKDSRIQKKQKIFQEKISICLETNKGSYTHTDVLESITNPENTILEFPISQLFQKYGNRNHPLAVWWVGRNFRALLWKWWIEESTIPQKLNHRPEKITSGTKYEIWDTIRFALINPALEGKFSQYLSNQLKEDWFTTFSDTNKSTNLRKENNEESGFVYDIVVKSLSTWESALALYRDWELYMATYVSVWLNNRKTKTWQFKIIWSNPYYYSKKYKSPMPDWLNFDEWWFWFHQGIVTKRPASHGCVRLPGMYAHVLYSLVHGKPNIDVFISKKLYNLDK